MNELFLSYASIDNRRLDLPGDHRGWVEFFYEYLLDMLVGRGFDGAPVWRDIEKLRGNTNSREALTKALQDARLLIAVLSPNYFKTKWCIGELLAFYRTAAARDNSDPHESIFRVFRYLFDEKLWPEKLGRFDVNRGYRFFNITNGVPTPYYESGEFQNKQAYLAAMTSLVADIENKLKSATVSTSPAPVELRPQVFLTASDEKTEEFALQLQAELRRLGIIASRLSLDANELPADQLRTSLGECLRGCRLSVHLIGRHSGPAVDGASISAFQLRFAAEQGILRVIWVPPEIWREVKLQVGEPGNDRASRPPENQDVLDPTHAAFLRRLDDGMDLGPKDDFIRERFEILRHHVVGILQSSGAET
jgi:hypothetical protein